MQCLHDTFALKKQWSKLGFIFSVSHELKQLVEDFDSDNCNFYKVILDNEYFAIIHSALGVTTYFYSQTFGFNTVHVNIHFFANNANNGI